MSGLFCRNRVTLVISLVAQNIDTTLDPKESVEVVWACDCEDTLGQTRACWRDFVTRLVLQRLGVPTEELEEPGGKKEA